MMERKTGHNTVQVYTGTDPGKEAGTKKLNQGSWKPQGLAGTQFGFCETSKLEFWDREGETWEE